MSQVSALESLLFVAIEPLKRDEIANILELELDDLDNIITAYKKKLAEDLDTGLALIDNINGLALCAKKENNEYVEKLLAPMKINLGKSALEVLAIVAYKQPITKTEIDRIRGVDTYHSIRKLLELELIFISGKKDIIGRPSLYETTNNFLEIIGISSLEELPEIEDDNIVEMLDEITEDDYLKAEIRENKDDI